MAYREKGATALAHGHRGRKPTNATSEAVIADVVHLARTRYDDATGTGVDALSCFSLTRGLLHRCGIPVALYTGRHGVFRHTPGTGLTGTSIQFSRAMDELGIKMIFALSPKAKGRVERTAGTFQGRLVTELRLSEAGSTREANSVLEQFLPRFSRRFRVLPQYLELAFRALDPELCLEQILCFKHRRKVGRNNTVRPQVHTFQLLPGPERPSYVGWPWRSWRHWTADCQCGTNGASSPPRRRQPVRYFSETAMGVSEVFLSRPPVPTA